MGEQLGAKHGETNLVNTLCEQIWWNNFMEYCGKTQWQNWV